MARETERLKVSKAAVASFVLAAWVAFECWSALFYCDISLDWNIDRLARAQGWEWTGSLERMWIILALWFLAPLVAIALGVKGYRDARFGEVRGGTWAVLGIIVAGLDLSGKVLFSIAIAGI